MQQQRKPRERKVAWSKKTASYATQRSQGLKIDTRPEIGTIQIHSFGQAGFCQSLDVPIEDAEEFANNILSAVKAAKRSNIPLGTWWGKPEEVTTSTTGV